MTIKVMKGNGEATNMQTNVTVTGKTLLLLKKNVMQNLMEILQEAQFTHLVPEHF